MCAPSSVVSHWNLRKIKSSLVFYSYAPLHFQGLQGPDLKAEYSGKQHPGLKVAIWNNEVLHVNT